MAQSKVQFKRRQHFIKKRFQFNFILKFCILIIIGGAISTGLLYFISKDTLTSSFQGSRLVVKSTAAAILPGIIYTNLITLILISVAAIVVTLYISHKIAGPLYRFEMDINEIAKGNLDKKIFLRKDDQAKDMAESLNAMVIGLHDRIVDIDGSLEQLTADAADKNAPEAVLADLKGLQDKIRTHFTF